MRRSGCMTTLQASCNQSALMMTRSYHSLVFCSCFHCSAVNDLSLCLLLRGVAIFNSLAVGPCQPVSMLKSSHSSSLVPFCFQCGYTKMKGTHTHKKKKHEGHPHTHCTPCPSVALSLLRLQSGWRQPGGCSAASTQWATHHTDTVWRGAGPRCGPARKPAGTCWPTPRCWCPWTAQRTPRWVALLGLRHHKIHLYPFMR